MVPGQSFAQNLKTSQKINEIPEFTATDLAKTTNPSPK
jgi:hypothetical protein